MESAALSRIGLAGLAVMGQNLALNVAEKGFPISVYNRTASKVDETVLRAEIEGGLPLTGHRSPREFVLSLARPRSIVILVKAGAPVDQTIAAFSQFMDPGDAIIDGGNEWYENTERRIREAQGKGLLYLGMGVSGGEDGARNGPSLMPGGSLQAYHNVQDILSKIAAQVDDGPCVTYIGEGGSGNFVKMVHNGIEYGDMQLISEAYDVLKTVGGLSNQELADIFAEWNRGELESFLIEITADIFKVKDEHGEGELVDKILDKTGMKGTGKWTVQQAAELSIAAPTIAASLDCRYLSGLKEERESAARILDQAGIETPALRSVAPPSTLTNLSKFSQYSMATTVAEPIPAAAIETEAPAEATEVVPEVIQVKPEVPAEEPAEVKEVVEPAAATATEPEAEAPPAEEVSKDDDKPNEEAPKAEETIDPHALKTEESTDPLAIDETIDPHAIDTATPVEEEKPGEAETTVEAADVVAKEGEVPAAAAPAVEEEEAPAAAEPAAEEAKVDEPEKAASE